jgi:hypothetical protein
MNPWCNIQSGASDGAGKGNYGGIIQIEYMPFVGNPGCLIK